MRVLNESQIKANEDENIDEKITNAEDSFFRMYKEIKKEFIKQGGDPEDIGYVYSGKGRYTIIIV